MALMLRADIRCKTVPDPAGARVIIEGLRFELGEGEIVALVGPSGCGKSTTLRIVAGLDTAFDGEMSWSSGQVPRIGTVFQEPRLLPWRTVAQNIAFVRPAHPGRVPTLLAELGLENAANVYPPALSLGMARRVALARAFAVEPDLLLLDEPFVSLDPVAAEAARRTLVQTWRSRHCAALLVTHDMAEAASLADRILKLSGVGQCRVADTLIVPAASRRHGIEQGARVAAALT